MARPFIIPDSQNGLRSVLRRAGRCEVRSTVGVLGAQFLRAARAGAAPPAPSEVAAFELDTGKLIGRWPFPAPGGTCNDIAIARDGSAYASDTPGGRILRLAKGGSALEVVGERRTPERHRWPDFGADGALYVNNVQKQRAVARDAAGAPASPRSSRC